MTFVLWTTTGFAKHIAEEPYPGLEPGTSRLEVLRSIRLS